MLSADHGRIAASQAGIGIDVQHHTLAGAAWPALLIADDVGLFPRDVSLGLAALDLDELGRVGGDVVVQQRPGEQASRRLDELPCLTRMRRAAVAPFYDGLTVDRTQLCRSTCLA